MFNEVIEMWLLYYLTKPECILFEHGFNVPGYTMKVWHILYYYTRNYRLDVIH